MLLFLRIAAHKGVWLGLGDAQPEEPWAAYEVADPPPPPHPPSPPRPPAPPLPASCRTLPLLGPRPCARTWSVIHVSTWLIANLLC